ncbi:MAG: hypothetical protein FD148_3276 [Methylocystaceae bacterium]|jgi:hypothetical protein|nr:MAG: hypothetical protein FD148_3276 [Methylocystaceae bacterium]
MTNAAGESDGEALRLDFDRRLKDAIRGSVVTSDVGVVALSRTRRRAWPERHGGRDSCRRLHRQEHALGWQFTAVWVRSARRLPGRERRERLRRALAFWASAPAWYNSKFYPAIDNFVVVPVYARVDGALFIRLSENVSG